MQSPQCVWFTVASSTLSGLITRSSFLWSLKDLLHGEESGFDTWAESSTPFQKKCFIPSTGRQTLGLYFVWQFKPNIYNNALAVTSNTVLVQHSVLRHATTTGNPFTFKMKLLIIKKKKNKKKSFFDRCNKQTWKTSQYISAASPKDTFSGKKKTTFKKTLLSCKERKAKHLFIIQVLFRFYSSQLFFPSLASWIISLWDPHESRAWLSSCDFKFMSSSSPLMRFTHTKKMSKHLL